MSRTLVNSHRILRLKRLVAVRTRDLLVRPVTIFLVLSQVDVVSAARLAEREKHVAGNIVTIDTTSVVVGLLDVLAHGVGR